MSKYNMPSCRYVSRHTGWPACKPVCKWQNLSFLSLVSGTPQAPPSAQEESETCVDIVNLSPAEMVKLYAGPHISTGPRQDYTCSLHDPGRRQSLPHSCTVCAQTRQHTPGVRVMLGEGKSSKLHSRDHDVQSQDTYQSPIHEYQY